MTTVYGADGAMAPPRPGDYLCVRTPGFVCAGIRLFTRSRFNHVAIVAEFGFLIEAEPGGVRRADITEYDGMLLISNAAEPTTAVQRAAVLDFATGQLGVPYNWDADVADGLACLGWRWKLLGRFAAGRKAIMCSQLVAAAGAAAGLPGWLCGKTTAAEVVPGDLAARIETAKW